MQENEKIWSSWEKEMNNASLTFGLAPGSFGLMLLAPNAAQACRPLLWALLDNGLEALCFETQKSIFAVMLNRLVALVRKGYLQDS